MKPIARICYLLLLFYPLIGIGQDSHRDVYVYFYHEDHYWDHHQEELTNNNLSLKFQFDGKQVKYSQELQEGEKWYHFEIETVDNQLPLSGILSYKDKSTIISIPQGGNTPIIITVLNAKVFPYGVKVFHEHEIHHLLKGDKLHIKGEIPIAQDVDQIVNEKVALVLPFYIWYNMPTSTAYQSSLQPNLEWDHATFEIEAYQLLYNSLAFLVYKNRYYPIMIQPGHHYEIKLTNRQTPKILSQAEKNRILEETIASIDESEIGEEEYHATIEAIIQDFENQTEILRKQSFNSTELLPHLKIESINGEHYHGVDPQDFFNERYPYGLSETAYHELVNAFVGDLSTRTDTLFTWSRAIVDYYEKMDEDPEEFLFQINQLGNQSRKDILERGYERYVDQKWVQAERRSMTWRRFLFIGIVLSIFLYVSVIILRLIKSRDIQSKHINIAESLLFVFASTTFLVMGMRTNHHSIIEVANLSAWILVASPLAIFFLNVRYLVPILLIKKKWGMYIIANMGFTLIYFIAAVGIMYSPIDNYGLCYVDNGWHLIWSQNKFQPNFHPDGGIAFHVILLALAPAYGLGRHFLFNRMPKLQQQKSALKAELTNLKTQISPHFFFNSLNTVYGFALSEDSPKTSEAITKLSDMMRFAIYHGNKDLVPLEKELDYLTDYVELQRLRLNPVRHELKFHIEGEPADLQIAPLLLITLVENAFKHGISMSQDSYIYIDLFIQSQGLILTVENSVHAGQLVPANGKETEEGGLGLANTQQRLDLLYSGHYEWNIEEEPDRYYTQLSIDLVK